LALFVGQSPNERELESITLEENKWYLACAPAELSKKFGWKFNTNKWTKSLLFFGKVGAWNVSKMEDFSIPNISNVDSKQNSHQTKREQQLAGGCFQCYQLLDDQEIADKSNTILEYPGLAA